MAKDEVQAIAYFLVSTLIIWAVYGSNHSENKFVPAVNSFWLGAVNFMIIFYLFWGK